MPQYTEGPEAKGMETGFALDELLRRQKAASTEQARQFGFNAGQTEQQHQNRLGEMLYGEQLKEKQAQAEAERTAPFLQTMLGSNPTAQKAFGFTETKTTPGELEAPEAGYPGTPPVTETVGRRPTLQEATGLSRAVPGMASELLKQAADRKPMVVASGSGIWDPNTNSWLAAPNEKEGGYKTWEEADAKRKGIIAANPTMEGRVYVTQNDKGAYVIKESATEPLSAQDPFKLGFKALTDRGVPVMEALGWYKQQLADAAGQKQFSIAINTPATPAQQDADQKKLETRMAFTNLQQMQATAPQTVESFLTWKGSGAELYNKLNRLPGANAVLQGLGQEEFVSRYNDWKANLGRIQGKVFDEGGKQLTPFEASVVYMSTPKETDSPSQYNAKMKWMNSYVGAQQEMSYWYRNNPKLAQDKTAVDNAWKAAQTRAGINTTDQYNWSQSMTPDQRAQNKMPR